MPYLHWICINTGKTWVMFNRMETAETGVHVRRRKSLTVTAWKVFKYEVFSGPYFPVFGLKTKIYCVRFRDFVQGKVIKIYRFRQFAFLISAIYTTRSFPFTTFVSWPTEIDISQYLCWKFKLQKQSSRVVL